MKRREFITLLGGAAAAWPLSRARSRPNACAASARSCIQPRKIRKYQPRIGAFLQELSQLGWSIGRNVRIDSRWGAGRCRHSQTCGGIGRARAGCHPGRPQP